MTTTAFRNVDASPDDPVETWPIEAIEATMERGSLRQWRRLVDAIRLQPWGYVARSVEHILDYNRPYGVDLLMERAIRRARDDTERSEASEVVER